MSEQKIDLANFTQQMEVQAANAQLRFNQSRMAMEQAMADLAGINQALLQVMRQEIEEQAKAKQMKSPSQSEADEEPKPKQRVKANAH